MAELEQRRTSISLDFWAILAALLLAVVMVVLATQAQAQTLQVIHDFSGGGVGGGVPQAGLTMGVWFSTTWTRPGSGGWSYVELHHFDGGTAGGYPYGNVVFDASEIFMAPRRMAE